LDETLDVIPTDSVMEILIKGKPLGPIHPGDEDLASDLWLIIERQAGTGPEVVVDDPALADVAEVHEYERKDLILRHQPDVITWGEWIVQRSGTQRFTLEAVSQDPRIGAPLWSWGMWHGARLGDTVTVTIEDGNANTHTVHLWIRGLEFRVAETLVLVAHLEAIPAPTFRDVPGLRVSYPEPDVPTPGTPFDGGQVIPDRDAPLEVPFWGSTDLYRPLGVTDAGELGYIREVVVKASPPSAADFGMTRIPIGAVWVEGF
jgi:hypothetical protein